MLDAMIYASSNFILLKIAESPKGPLFVWVTLMISSILAIKSEKFLKYLSHVKIIIINPLHANINYSIYFQKALFSVPKRNREKNDIVLNLF